MRLTCWFRPSFADTVEADKMGNRVSGTGKAVMHAGKNNLVYTTNGHTVALLGVDDLVVVQTADATLVMPRAKAEELKLIHGMLDDRLK